MPAEISKHKKQIRTRNPPPANVLNTVPTTTSPGTSWPAGAGNDEDARFASAYRQLRDLARQKLRGEPATAPAPTALVHDVLLRLGLPRSTTADAAELARLAAGVMRHMLVDQARRRQRRRQALAAHADRTTPTDDERLRQLPEALDRLAACDPGLARVVELRFLVGLDVNDTAAALGISTATVVRDWRTARAFLQRELGQP